MARKQNVGQYSLEFEAVNRTQNTLLRIEALLKKMAVQNERLARTADKVTRANRTQAAATDKLAKKQANLAKRMVVLATKAFAAYQSIRLLVRGAQLAIETFARFESLVIQVAKTAGLSSAEVVRFAEAINRMATTGFFGAQGLPVARDKLVQMAVAAGQLGIKGVENITKFTHSMAVLESSSNVTADEGSRALGRIINVTDTVEATTDRFVSALVDLGNNAATTEARILHMTQTIGQNTVEFGISTQLQLAAATALSEVGQEAESAGSSMQRLFQRIQMAADGDNSLLQKFAKVLGVTTAEAQALAEVDPGKFFTKMLEGLNRSGESVWGFLSDIGLPNIRVKRVLGVLVNRAERVKTLLKQTNTAWYENIAAIEEAARVSNTHFGRMQDMRNEMDEALTEVGSAIAPIWEGIYRVLTDVMKMTADFTTWFTNQEGKTNLKVGLSKMSDEELYALASGRGDFRTGEKSKRPWYAAFRDDDPHKQLAGKYGVELNDVATAVSRAIAEREATNVGIVENAQARREAAETGNAAYVQYLKRKKEIEEEQAKARYARDSAAGHLEFQEKMEQHKKDEEKRLADLEKARQEAFQKEVARQVQLASVISSNVGSALSQLAFEGGKLSDVLGNAFKNIAQSILQATIQAMLMRAVLSSIGGPAGAAGIGGLPLPPIPGLASGGSAKGGRPYLVGEAGPELFVPRTDGMVHSAGSTRGMMDQPITVVVKNYGGVTTEVEEYVSGAVSVGNQQTISVMVEEIQTPGSQLNSVVAQARG